METTKFIKTLFIMVGIFPTTLESFNTYAAEGLQYLLDNKVRLKIDPADVVIITGLLTDWNDLWDKYTDPALNTDDVIDDLHEQHDLIITELERIYASIPDNVLITADRNRLHLFKKKTTHTRVGVKGNAPKITLDGIQHLEHILRITDPATPDAKKMPEGQIVVLEKFVGAANLAADQVMWGGTRNVRHFVYHNHFTDADVQKVCYYRVCYESTHGERSDWSATLSQAIA